MSSVQSLLKFEAEIQLVRVVRIMVHYINPNCISIGDRKI